MVNIEVINKHFKNALQLYIHPIKALRSATSNRKNAYTQIINYVIYYVLLGSLMFTGELKCYLPIVLDLLITIIPFIVFLSPFLVFVKLNGKRLKWFHLFRVLLVLKLQLVPFFIILNLLTSYFEYDFLYIALNNFIWIIWIVNILTVPLLINVSKMNKALWILFNWIFFVLFVAITSKLLMNGFGVVEMENAPKKNIIKYLNFQEKISNNSPILEIMQFDMKHGNLNFNDKYYFAILEGKINGYGGFKVHPVFFSKELMSLISNLEDKVSVYNGNLSIHPSDSSKIFLLSDRDFNQRILDSIKVKFDKEFMATYEELKYMKDSCYYISNREYFRTYFNYLDSYNSFHLKFKEIDDRIKYENKIRIRIPIDDSTLAVLIRLHPKYYPKHRDKFASLRETMIQRQKHYFFVMHLLLFPIYILE